MSSSTLTEASQLVNSGKDKAAVNSNYANEKTTAAKTRRKPSTMTRRLSFSMTRSWSSYNENYSSCLTGLKRRNSSEQLMKSQGSLQSSPSSSSTDLSKSLDSEKLRNSKANTPDSEFKPRSLKISGMHARPFHQRRWSSPVAFSVNKLAPSAQQPASNQLKKENTSVDILQDSKDKSSDKICESDEIILSQEQDKTPVSVTEHSSKHSMSKVGETESLPSQNNYDSDCHTRPTCLKAHTVKSYSNKTGTKVEYIEENIKMDENQSSSTKDETMSASLPKSPDVQAEDAIQNRNIYSEIKKNTKWSKSKNFRRRHHTIHADSRRFMNPTLFTIAEQSSGSFGNLVGNGENERYDKVRSEKLKSRRSKSLGDIDTLSDDFKTNGVSVQQLCAKSICVSVAGNKNKKKEEVEARSVTTTVKYEEEKSESSYKKQHPVQVNIQTFSRIQITSGVSGGDGHKPQTSSKMQPFISTKQHVVFTQPKAKWSSITISQV